MQSISEIFDAYPAVQHLVVFRCKRNDDDLELYRRNRRWLAQGKTGYWNVAEDRELDGMLILMDAEDGDAVEAWLGVGVERLELVESGRWVLGTQGGKPFTLLGRVETGLNEFIGRQVLIGATYVDADDAPDGGTMPTTPRKKQASGAGVPFVIGRTYHRRRDIHSVYGGQQRGGIATPSTHPVVFLFAGSSGSLYGYRDGWQDDGTFTYTGEGQIGDMRFIRGNAAIRDHSKNGKDLLLFEEVEGGDRWRFSGRFDCAGWRETTGPDKNGNTRKVLVFTLVPEGQTDTEIDEQDLKALTKLPLSQLRARALAASEAPSGDPKTTLRKHYERSAAVKAYVLSRANGVCEACEQPAPFKKADGAPYLEPHHIRRVSDGGPDHPRFVAGICPTCHRRVHHGADGAEWNERILARIAVTEPDAEE
jgi:5-methylcytosine-specific restriction protein A